MVRLTSKGQDHVLCIKPNNSNGKIVPCDEHEQMDEYKYYCAQNSVRALYNMLMKVWVILGSNKHVGCSKHNINGEGYKYKFNNLFFDVWCANKFGHHLMHIHLIYKLLWIMGLGYLWNLDLSFQCKVLICFGYGQTFSKWLELVSLSNRSSEIATYAFLD